MGAIKSLKSWWRAIVAKDELDTWDGQPTPEEARKAAAELKKMRASLDTWALATFSFLGSEVADQISSRLRKAARNEDGEMVDFVSALRVGLVSDFFWGKRKAFTFLFEARYTENAEIVFCKVCSSYGIKDKFLYDEAINGADPLKVLPLFRGWLLERSFDLIIFDTGGDEYCGFLVPSTSCQDALVRLRNMGIRSTNIPSEA